MGFEAYSFSTGFASRFVLRFARTCYDMLNLFESPSQGAQAPCLVPHSKTGIAGFIVGA